MHVVEQLSAHDTCGLEQAVHSHRADPDEINLLYRMFDSNKDGFLELGAEASRDAGFYSSP